MLRDTRGHGSMIMLRCASSIMERCVCKDLRRKVAQQKLAVVFCLCCHRLCCLIPAGLLIWEFA